MLLVACSTFRDCCMHACQPTFVLSHVTNFRNTVRTSGYQIEIQGLYAHTVSN